MNIKRRFLGIFLLIFILGFFAGVLLTAALVRRQLYFDKYDRTEAGFPEAIGRIIRIEDSQKSVINPILLQKSKQFQHIQQKNKEEFSVFLDSLQHDLSPLLEDVQKERLSRRLKEIQKKIQNQD